MNACASAAGGTVGLDAAAPAGPIESPHSLALPLSADRESTATVDGSATALPPFFHAGSPDTLALMAVFSLSAALSAPSPGAAAI